MPFLIETHFHTSEVSTCAHVPAAEGIRRVKARGYQAVVVTDHYTPEFFAAHGQMTQQQQIEQYLSGYQAARAAGESVGLLVLPGMEIRFPENYNDYLVYGFEPEFLFQYPDLWQHDLTSFAAFCRHHDLLIYQAHPFRRKMTVVVTDLLDGIEGVNGNPRHDSKNDIAIQWAQRHNLPMIGGSDFHQAGDEGASGLLLRDEITDIHGLKQQLKTGNYSILLPASRQGSVL